MRLLLAAAPALLLAACTAVPGDLRPNPTDTGAEAPPVAFSSTFEGYRPFAEEELQDWRKANEQVGATQTSKPRPPKPDSSGAHE